MKKISECTKKEIDKHNNSFEFNGEKINLKKIRKQLNMSQVKFAKAFYFSTRSIESWEGLSFFPPLRELNDLLVQRVRDNGSDHGHVVIFVRC